MNVLGVIPARGGSKRLPGKNILPINGMPMIGWTIKAAIDSEVFEDVIVYTDSEEISRIAIELGALVPFLREPADADDFTPSSIATLNALVRFEEVSGKKYDYVAQLMANCPCRDSDDIAQAFEHFIKNNVEFQISSFKFGWMNPWWAMRLESDFSPKPLFQEALSSRSQDLDSLYCPTGAVWFAKKDALIQARTFYGENYKLYPMNWMSAVDIDDQEDFEMAETVLLLKSQKKKKNE